MNLQAYHDAHETSAWREMSHFGRFQCTGQDAPALLHHLTTNDIKGLRPGAGCDAALITSKARVLDWLTIFRLPESLLVVTSPNRRDLFRPHAEKFILFRQDVHLTDVTAATALCGLCGPRVQEVLDVMGAPDITQSPLNALHTFRCDGMELTAARTRRLPQGGVLLWSEDGDGLRRIVSTSGRPVLDDATYNVLRVEAGLPAAGLELTEEINPWEAALGDAISLNKGCYNGQEVVARLHTYHKVKQALCGLKLRNVLPPSQRARLRASGRDAGFLTSSVESPRLGPIALAYVRGDYRQPGQQLDVVLDDASQPAVVTLLPFQL